MHLFCLVYSYIFTFRTTRVAIYAILLRIRIDFSFKWIRILKS